jgi:hypothetical protein
MVSSQYLLTTVMFLTDVFFAFQFHMENKIRLFIILLSYNNLI